MAIFDEHLLAEAISKFPKPDVTFSYGTAGFRARAETLPSVCFRMGLIGALRSVSLQGKVVGLMITASHNPEPDNGIKMVDARGEMLAAEWEPVCTRIANASTKEDLVKEIQNAIQTFNIDMEQYRPHVVHAHDTRPSSPDLVQAVVAGLRVFDTDNSDAGLLTTPQLHFLVMASNTDEVSNAYDNKPLIECYYQKLSNAFTKLMDGCKLPMPIVVDCANGVGAQALQSLLSTLPSDIVDITMLRTAMSEKGQLNNGCGADFVKSHQCLPKGYDAEAAIKPGSLLCSFDGDADRIVFYYLTGPASEPSSFHLLDGDKIATLATDYISELVKKANLGNVRVGCVQTAYANGASTAYLEEHHVPVTCTKTGVKHLHHAAEQYEIGVYFEANGHGTVLFSPSAMVAMNLVGMNDKVETSTDALSRLRLLAMLINQTIGDAVSDLLLVLAILALRGWDAAQWDACYTDLPNRLTKVSVPDRTAFRTTDAERKLETPPHMQSKIDELVAKTPRGRSFVRPSGTEDCVRVYAEAATQEDAERLVHAVEDLVKTA